jgi:peptidyl-prolyl cis-trans isomerase SurA
MKKIYGVLLLFLGILLALDIFAEAKPVVHKAASFTPLDKIIAIVNNEVITQSQLNDEITQEKKQLQRANTPMPSDKEIHSKMLDQLIAKKLQLQLAKARNIQVTDADLDKAIDNIAKTNHLNLAQLKQALTQTGIEYPQFRARIHEQILVSRLQQQEFAKTITLTSEEVKEFLRKNQGKMNKYNAFHLIDMVLPISDATATAQITSLRQQAQTIAQQLQHGKRQEDIAKQFSNLQSNDLGWRALADLPPIFTEKLPTMNIGATSNPIQAPNGFHILKLVDARGESAKLTEKDAQNLIYQRKVTEKTQEWLKELRKTAYVKIV